MKTDISKTPEPEKVCPTCGTCPTCGAKKQEAAAPYVPIYVYPYIAPTYPVTQPAPYVWPGNVWITNGAAPGCADQGGSNVTYAVSA